MVVKLQRLNELANIPTKASEHAAAFDLFATSINIVNETGYGYIEYGTGWAMEIPVGYVGKLYPRSSISKTGLILANSVGIIDPDYRGEIMFRYKWIPNAHKYAVGDRIGQIRIEKTIPTTWELVETLSETLRGSGGFGSTDK